jgi:carbon storage regulator
MLVLSRKAGEQLYIGDNIVLTVSRINGNRVAIAIDAPRDVRIVRAELERHTVAAGPNTPVAMSIDQTNVCIASKPQE